MDQTLAPVRVPLTAWLAAAVAALMLYVMLQENGALLASSCEALHELFHDGRHLVGVACH